jgi:hypothetical protein
MIAWKETVFLNLIAQLQFRLDVSCCVRSTTTTTTSDDDDDDISAKKNKNKMEIMNALKHNVYASPHHQRVESKHSATRWSYPQIHFSLHDFDSHSVSVGVGQYLTVELFLPVPTTNGLVEVCVFQGAVPYAGLMDVYTLKSQPPHPAIKQFQRFTTLLQNSLQSTPLSPLLSQSPKMTDEGVFIHMRGPGGKGMAQVALNLSADGGGVLVCSLTYVSLPWTSIIKDLIDAGIGIETTAVAVE